MAEIAASRATGALPHGIRPQAVVNAAHETVPGRVVPVLAFVPRADVKKREEGLLAGRQRVVPQSVLAADLPQLVKSILRV